MNIKTKDWYNIEKDRTEIIISYTENGKYKMLICEEKDKKEVIEKIKDMNELEKYKKDLKPGNMS